MLKTCHEMVNIDFISLDPDDAIVSSEGFCKIRLRANIYRECKKEIDAVLKMHKLEIKENKDLVVIYRKHPRQ